MSWSAYSRFKIEHSMGNTVQKIQTKSQTLEQLNKTEKVAAWDQELRRVLHSVCSQYTGKGMQQTPMYVNVKDPVLGKKLRC